MIFQVHQVLNPTIENLIVLTSFRFLCGIFLLSGSNFEQGRWLRARKKLEFQLVLWASKSRVLLAHHLIKIP